MTKEEIDIKFSILEELRVILQVKPGESITSKAKEVMETCFKYEQLSK